MMDELKMISKYAGMREDLVQAGGGNTSVKVSDKKMYIKASGYQLADVSMASGSAQVNPRKIIDFFTETPLEEIDINQEKELLNMAFLEGERPSIETFLHAITDRVTLHTHPVSVNILASRNSGMKELKKLFPDAIFVPYATPGICLAREYFRVWKENGKKLNKIIFLKNHGLIINGKTAEEVINKNEEVLSTLTQYLGMDHSDYETSTQIYNMLLQIGGNENVVYLSQNRHIYEALHLMNNIWHHEMCPDCIVYCGKKVLELNDIFCKQDIEKHCIKYGQPAIIKWKSSFYIVAPTIKKAKEIESILGFSAQVAIGNFKENMDILSETEQDFLLNWDAEKFRRNMR